MCLWFTSDVDRLDVVLRKPPTVPLIKIESSRFIKSLTFFKLWDSGLLEESNFCRCLLSYVNSQNTFCFYQTFNKSRNYFPSYMSNFIIRTIDWFQYKYYNGFDRTIDKDWAFFLRYHFFYALQRSNYYYLYRNTVIHTLYRHVEHTFNAASRTHKTLSLK